MPSINEKWQHVVHRIEKLFVEKIAADSSLLRKDLRELVGTIENGESPVVLFSQLSQYFEVGFMFEETSELPLWNSVAAFVGGQTLITDSEKGTQLPRAEFGEILRGDARKFLNRMGLTGHDPHRKLSALLVRVSESCQFVLLTRTADPWLQKKSTDLRDVVFDYQAGRSR